MGPIFSFRNQKHYSSSLTLNLGGPISKSKENIFNPNKVVLNQKIKLKKINMEPDFNQVICCTKVVADELRLNIVGSSKTLRVTLP